jgi:hypothetical protein
MCNYSNEEMNRNSAERNNSYGKTLGEKLLNCLLTFIHTFREQSNSFRYRFSKPFGDDASGNGTRDSEKHNTLEIRQATFFSIHGN